MFPLNMFYKHKLGKFGVDSKCKTCLKSSVVSRGPYKSNPEVRKKASRTYLEKHKGSERSFKRLLQMSLRGRLRKAIKRNQKAGSAVADLGCSIDFFKQYLESKFQPGMSWDNRSNWHIDHIKPLSKFDLSKRDQLLEACNYRNLQPMWAVDNMIKGNRLR